MSEFLRLGFGLGSLELLKVLSLMLREEGVVGVEEEIGLLVLLLLLLLLGLVEIDSESRRLSRSLEEWVELEKDANRSDLALWLPVLGGLEVFFAWFVLRLRDGSLASEKRSMLALVFDRILDELSVVRLDPREDMLVPVESGEEVEGVGSEGLENRREEEPVSKEKEVEGAPK